MADFGTELQKFLFRFDRPFFWPAAALNPEPGTNQFRFYQRCLILSNKSPEFMIVRIQYGKGIVERRGKTVGECLINRVGTYPAMQDVLFDKKGNFVLTTANNNLYFRQRLDIQFIRNLISIGRTQ
jgi:hypothetical protein